MIFSGIFLSCFFNSVPWLRQTSERFDWTLRRSRRPPAQRTSGIAEIGAAKIALDRRWNWRFRYRSRCLTSLRETSCLLWFALRTSCTLRTLRSCGLRRALRTQRYCGLRSCEPCAIADFFRKSSSAVVDPADLFFSIVYHLKACMYHEQLGPIKK